MNLSDERRDALERYNKLREKNPHLPPPDRVVADSVSVEQGRYVLPHVTLSVFVELPEE